MTLPPTWAPQNTMQCTSARTCASEGTTSLPFNSSVRSDTEAADVYRNSGPRPQQADVPNEAKATRWSYHGYAGAGVLGRFCICTISAEISIALLFLKCPAVPTTDGMPWQQSASCDARSRLLPTYAPHIILLGASAKPPLSVLSCIQRAQRAWPQQAGVAACMAPQYCKIIGAHR